MRIRATEIGLMLLSLILLSTMSSMVLAAKATAKVEGHGWLQGTPYNKIQINIVMTDDGPRGHVTYQERELDYKLQGTQITSLTTGPFNNWLYAVIHGTGKVKVKGEGWYECTFIVMVYDKGDPEEWPPPDWAQVYIEWEDEGGTQSYYKDGDLGGGNIKISEAG